MMSSESILNEMSKEEIKILTALKDSSFEDFPKIIVLLYMNQTKRVVELEKETKKLKSLVNSLKDMVVTKNVNK